MAPLRFRTVRAKLIATTLLVFAAMLIVVGFVFVQTSRQALMSSVDSDLQRRGVDFANEIAKRGAPGGPPRNEFGTNWAEGRRPMGPRPGLDPKWIAPLAVPVESASRQFAYDYNAFLISAKGQSLFTTLTVDGEPRRVFSAPAIDKGKVVFVVQVSNSLGPALSALASQRQILLRYMIPFGLLLGIAASWIVVSSLLKPLRHITAEAERIGKEGFGEKLLPQGQDEFSALIDTLNGMLGRLEDVYRLEQKANRQLEETVDQQRRFTSDASHELKTPLSVIKAYLGVLKTSQRSVPDEAEVILAMDEGANRMTVLIQDLLTLAAADSEPNESGHPCSLQDVIESAIRSVPGTPTQTRLLVQSQVSVLGSFDELMRVFINLIENAVKHSDSSNPIEIELSSENQFAIVHVRDNGVGISSEHLPHIFERFYRTDGSRASDTGGSGLGLAICEQIVQSHGGSISVVSEVGYGTCFSVFLPRLVFPCKGTELPSTSSEVHTCTPH